MVPKSWAELSKGVAQGRGLCQDDSCGVAVQGRPKVF